MCATGVGEMSGSVTITTSAITITQHIAVCIKNKGEGVASRDVLVSGECGENI